MAYLTTGNQGLRLVAPDGSTAASVDFQFQQVSGVIVAADLAVVWGKTIFAAYNGSGAQVWTRDPITITTAVAAGADRIAYVRNGDQGGFTAGICDAATGHERGYGEGTHCFEF